jgi:hypothetical protein
LTAGQGCSFLVSSSLQPSREVSEGIDGGGLLDQHSTEQIFLIIDDFLTESETEIDE